MLTILRLSALFKRRIALVIFGICLFFALMEAGLRLGGWVVSSLQERRNNLSIRQKGAYRILCLGESTTQGQYPKFLEQALNQRNIGVHFGVIDKGRAGMNTPMILSQVASFLDEYHPEMVVAMMGINDGEKLVPFKIAATSKTTLLVRSLRTYKLIRLLWLHILNKVKERIRLKEACAELAPTENEYIESGCLLQYQGKFGQAEDAFKKALELNPKNGVAYARLGGIYRDQGKAPQAEDALKKALELNPKNNLAYNDHVYIGLGSLYQDQGKFVQAEDAFKKAIELNPKNYNAHIKLGWFYRDQGKFLQSEEKFKKAVELSPENVNIFIELGYVYRVQGKFSQAEEALKKAVELGPKNLNVCFELGWFYQNQGKSFQAENVFKKAIELNPSNYSAYKAISIFYEETGKLKLAKEYAGKAARLRLEYYAPVTAESYHKLKEILDRKGIRLVCVQYPMRNVEPLKKIFEDDPKDIIFVDNENTFKDAVKKDGSNAYFKDRFGGDFGHCTDKGNKLLAENIANTILKEAFGTHSLHNALTIKVPDL